MYFLTKIFFYLQIKNFQNFKLNYYNRFRKYNLFQKWKMLNFK